MSDKHHQILIIGAGAAGITVAASLKRHSDGKQLDIAIVDPASNHYYQPAFTLVGGGCYSLEKTRRSTSSLIPSGVSWVKQAAAVIASENNVVELDNGDKITYVSIVVCSGVAVVCDAVDGLKDSVGHHGVCSNY